MTSTTSEQLKIPPASETPFDSVADHYDQSFSYSAIGRAQREAVWKEMNRAFQRGQRIFEINCGTGIDALHLAQRGVHVDACDSSSSMVRLAEQRLAGACPSGSVRFRRLSIEELHRWNPDELYDGVLSNFSGLDCVSDLEPVSWNLARLVKPGGYVVLCVFGSFCLWETCWHLIAGNREKALRRLKRGGIDARIAPGVNVRIHYRTAAALIQAFSPYFYLKRWRGVGVVSPPSFAGSIPDRFPTIFRLSLKMDSLAGPLPGLRKLADHAVFTFRRAGGLAS